MENENSSRYILFGVIGLLVIAVIGLAVDRSNQITTLSEQVTQVAEEATTAAEDAQTAEEDMSATIEAQIGEIDSQSEVVIAAETSLEDLQTQVAVSSTAFEDEISELESAADVLESNNEDFATQVAELSDTNEAQATEIAELSTQSDDLSAQRDELSTEVANAMDSVATAEADALIQADIAATSQADALIQADNAATQSAVAATTSADSVALAEQYDESVNALSTLEASNAALQVQIEELLPTETASPEPTTVSEADDIDTMLEVDIDNAGVVEILPDSSSIAVLRDDNVIEFISAEDGTSQRELTDLDEGVQDFTFSNSGRSMAVVIDFSQVMVMDSATGVVSFDEAIRNPVRGYDFAGDDGALAVLTGLETEIFPFDESPSVTRIGGVTLDWSADGTMIAQTDGNLVELLMMDEYQIDEVVTIETDGGSILDLELSPDGSLIAGISADGMVMVWDVASAELSWSADSGVETVDDFDWSGDSAHLAVVASGEVSIYSADGTSTVTTTIGEATTVDWSADGSFIVFSDDETVTVVSADALSE